jgi:signal transduction histidine kinase
MQGGPGYLENTLKQIQRYVLSWFFISGALLIGGWWAVTNYLDINRDFILGGLSLLWLIISFTIGRLVAFRVSAPLKALSEAILHISPTPLPVKPPEVEKLTLGRELVANLIRQTYEINTGIATVSAAQQADLSLQQLPVSIVSVDEEGNIEFANSKAQEFTGQNDMVGKNLYSMMDLFFEEEGTLQDWIIKVKTNSITTQKIWRGVRIADNEGAQRYIDLAASYVKQVDGSGQILLVIFDETDVYGEQYDSLSFISLAVHELRTPLTILRGYIEVFEEELNKAPDSELHKFMEKMKASAENLTAFVGNILNVAKIDQNQLTLHLNKEDWPKVLTSIIEDMRLRANVRGKNIKLEIAPDLPEVGIDRISIAEVINNLLDNAIKYSPDGKNTIVVTSFLNKEGLVETTVQDFGVGIAESVMPHLFEKFSRNYRNRAQIGGTGLGLFLSKALVTAHGGNIWVRSHEGEGSVFGFTILPFDQIDNDQQNSDSGIVRHAHGWIKNHALVRK